MQRLVFSFDQKVIPRTSKVWLLHPGKKHSFYPTFKRTKRVFMETPGLVLPQNQRDLTTDLVRQIRMAKVVSDWYDSEAPAAGEPSRDFRTYRLSRAKYVAAVERFFLTTGDNSQARAGDVVMVPGPQNSPVLFGELGEHGERTMPLARYNNERVPFRKVNWVKQDKGRFELPHEIYSRLRHNPQVLSLFGGKTDVVYDYMYDGNWARVGNEASTCFAIGHDDRHVDYYALSNALKLVCYYAALARALEQGLIDEASGMSIQATIDRFYDPAIFSGEISLHSRGRVLNRVLRPLDAIIVAAALSATTPALAVEAPEPIQVEVPADWNPVDGDCDKDAVEGALGTLLNSISANRLAQLCSLKESGADALNLVSPVEADVTNTTAEE